MSNAPQITRINPITPLTACLVLLACTLTAATREPRPSPAETFLDQAQSKMANHTFGKKDYRECERFLKKARNIQRLPFLLILAWYQRVIEKRPGEALMMLLPEVLERDKLAAWLRENTRTGKDALARWRQERQRARQEEWDEMPRKPAGPFAPLPPCTEWKLDSRTAACALEIARCLMDSGRLQEAMAIINAVGEKFEDLPRALAAECGGDLMVGLQRYRNGIDFYELGLKVLRFVSSQSSEGEAKECRQIRNRLRRKLEEAKRLFEMEKYGRGWVLYRDAEAKRRKEKAYLEAYLAYEEIQDEFAKTVWAEAAACYAIKCLLALADADHAKHAQDTIAALERQLQLKKARLHAAKHAQAPRGVRNQIENSIEELEARLARMKKVPTGKQAARTAERLGKAFIAANEFGLYRGEVMLALANYWLETALNPRMAEKWYQQAKRWFQEVGDVDVDLAAFAVPEEAKAVSAPPPSERTRDAWTNVIVQEPKIGDLFNRRTCSWYVGHLLKEVVLKYGLVKFAEKDFKSAESIWRELYTLDSFYAEEERRGWGSVVERLLFDLKKDRRSLYANPDEMKEFRTPKLRLAVFIADLAYENAEYPRAEAWYERILSGKYGRLTRNQRAYLTFALIRSAAMQFKKEKKAKLMADFEEKFKGSPTMPRFLLYRGGCYLTDLTKVHPGSEGWQKGIRDYQTLVQRYPRTLEADYAMFDWGKTYYLAGDLDEATRLFEEYLRRYPNGIWNEFAKYYLGLCRKGIRFQIPDE